jgi:NDP-sugar pyrophosphorylase family protein
VLPERPCGADVGRIAEGVVVTVEPMVRGGIIAAGAGSRLRQAGWPMPKPMVPVAGVPLIAHVIDNFITAGITSLVIIVNEQERDCANWVRSRFPDIDLRFIVKTTRSSLASFLAVGRCLGSGRVLISTVDAWCPAEEFVRFVRAARQYPPEAVVLGVTPLVADERPLWVALNACGRLTSLGGEVGEMVTAGVYLVPERVRSLSPPRELGRLREFLAWLVTQGQPVYGVIMERVVDVDRAEDVALAEALAQHVIREPEEPWGGVR